MGPTAYSKTEGSARLATKSAPNSSRNGSGGSAAGYSKSLVATRTPSRTNRSHSTVGSDGQSKFDFDAPQFEDFTKPQYRHTKRLLEIAVLPPEQRSDWKVQDCPRDGLGGQDEPFDDHNFGDCGPDGGWRMEEDLIEDWFQRHHTEHEPSSPFSPAGPLITPESANRANVRLYGTPRSATRTKGPVGQSPLSLGDFHTGSAPRQSIQHVSTPRTPLRSFGLRAKPMRVLASASDCSSSLGGIGSAMQNTALTNSTAEEESESMNTPTMRLSRKASTRWRVSVLTTDHLDDIVGRDARRSSSIDGYHHSSPSGADFPLADQEEEARRDTDELRRRLSTSLPSIAGWSSIPESPPVLACGLTFDDDVNYLGKRPLPKESPIALAAAERDKGLRRIGLGAKALRVERPAVDIEDYRPPPALLARPKARSPLIKRVKVDARFCPAPPVIKSRNGSPKETATSSFPLAMVGKKEKPVKLDELKKLLADHNQKLRPQINFNRRR